MQHQIEVYYSLFCQLLEKHPEMIPVKPINSFLFHLIEKNPLAMVPFVNSLVAEQDHEKSIAAWKGNPNKSDYWKYYMQNINSSNASALTQMLLRCAPLSDCRIVFEQSLTESLSPILNEDDYIGIINIILPFLLSLLKNEMDRSVFHQVVESMGKSLSYSNYSPILPFLYFCESLFPSHPDALLEAIDLLTTIYQYCDEKTIAIKVMKKIRSSLKRIAIKVRANDHLSASCGAFLALFDWESILSPKKRKVQPRLYNRNPAINELLKEEAGSDNYDDLTNFIDPTPDISIKEVRQLF